MGHSQTKKTELKAELETNITICWISSHPVVADLSTFGGKKHRVRQSGHREITILNTSILKHNIYITYDDDHMEKWLYSEM